MADYNIIKRIEKLEYLLNSINRSFAYKGESIDDISSDSADTTYSAAKIEERLAESGGAHRGVAIYNQLTEPTDQEDGDIWVVRQPI